MLNYETLLSSYDDKLTLMQWLKKVEAALKDASAVSFNVNKRGDATLTFSVVFEDGSELESNPITLQQGESVASAYIQNGNLHLVLTNGDDLDAGNMFNGDVTLTGDLTAVGVHATGDLTAVGVHATGTGVKTSVITQDVSSGIDVFASVVSLNNGLNAQGTIASDSALKTPVLTSDEAEISAQKPVVEVMNGYSFTTGATQANINNIYAGVCKNGNKITIVYFFKIERTGSASYEFPITINIPASVGSKLYPYELLGTLDFLDRKIVNATDTTDGSFIDLVAVCRKTSNVSLGIGFYRLSNLELNREYLVRYELTLLLSDNLLA